MTADPRVRRLDDDMRTAVVATRGLVDDSEGRGLGLRLPRRRQVRVCLSRGSRRGHGVQMVVVIMVIMAMMQVSVRRHVVCMRHEVEVGRQLLSVWTRVHPHAGRHSRATREAAEVDGVALVRTSDEGRVRVTGRSRRGRGTRRTIGSKDEDVIVLQTQVARESSGRWFRGRGLVADIRCSGGGAGGRGRGGGGGGGCD